MVEAENSESQKLQDILFNSSVNTASFENLYDSFLTNGPQMQKLHLKCAILLKS